MCSMGRWSFWSWFDVNRPTLDKDMREKRFSHFYSQWPWPFTFRPQICSSYSCPALFSTKLEVSTLWLSCFICLVPKCIHYLQRGKILMTRSWDLKIGTNKIASNLRQLIRSACVKQRIWHWQGLAMVLVVEFPLSNIELRLFKQQLSYKVSYKLWLIFILHSVSASVI